MQVSSFSKSVSLFLLYTFICIIFLRFFFNVDHFLKCLLNLLQYCLSSTLWLFWPWDMWHPSPQPGIKLAPSALEGKVPTAGLPGKSQESLFCTQLLCWALSSPYNSIRQIYYTHLTDVETREREGRELSQHLLGSGGVRSYTRQAGSTVPPLYYAALKNSKICCILGCLVESRSVVSILRRT